MDAVEILVIDYLLIGGSVGFSSAFCGIVGFWAGMKVTSLMDDWMDVKPEEPQHPLT
jgi:hypothetical protein